MYTKSYFLKLAAIAAVLCSSYSCTTRSLAMKDLEGTWVLTTGMDRGSAYPYNPGQKNIKVYKKNSFSSYMINGQDTVRSMDGSYKVSGSVYTETIHYKSDRSIVSLEEPFSYRIWNNDIKKKFIIDGSYTLKSDNHPITSFLYEIWEKQK